MSLKVSVPERGCLGGRRERYEVENLCEAIMRALADKSMTEPEIDGAIEGKTTIKRRALRELTGNRRIVRSGSGKRGNPFRYEKASSLVPAPLEETGNKKPNEGVSAEPNGEANKLFPLSVISTGTGEQAIIPLTNGA